MTSIRKQRAWGGFVLTVALVPISGGGPAMAQDDRVDALVGVWESVSPGTDRLPNGAAPP